MPPGDSMVHHRFSEALIVMRKMMRMMLMQVEGVQVQGGTGGLRLAAEFLKRCMKRDVVYVSKPTWGKMETKCMLFSG